MINESKSKKKKIKIIISIVQCPLNAMKIWNVKIFQKKKKVDLLSAFETAQSGLWAWMVFVENSYTPRRG